VTRYENIAPETLSLFLDWIGMTEAGFNYLINQHRDTRVWIENDDGTWLLKDSCTRHRDDDGVDAVRLAKVEKCHFEVTPPKIKDPQKDAYTLIGRGHVDTE
jgi:hypothetical protein